VTDLGACRSSFSRLRRCLRRAIAQRRAYTRTATVRRVCIGDRNLDLGGMTVQVEHGAYQGELVPVKTRASRRRVDLSSTAAQVLRRQLLARKPNERGLVFPLAARRAAQRRQLPPPCLPARRSP
jgi:hypothetical protein